MSPKNIFSCIYRICHITNNELMYIGSTKNFNTRMSSHKHNIKYGLQNRLYSCINANGGLECFKFDILKTFENLTKIELRKKEDEFIKLFNPSLNTNRAYVSDEEKRANNLIAVKKHRENNEEYINKCNERSKEFRNNNPDYMKEYYKKRKRDFD